MPRRDVQFNSGRRLRLPPAHLNVDIAVLRTNADRSILVLLDNVAFDPDRPRIVAQGFGQGDDLYDLSLGRRRLRAIRRGGGDA